MPSSMFLKANVQRLGSYQKLYRLNSLNVHSGVANLSMPRGYSTTIMTTLTRLHLSSCARMIWRCVVPRVCD